MTPMHETHPSIAPEQIIAQPDVANELDQGVVVREDAVIELLEASAAIRKADSQSSKYAVTLEKGDGVAKACESQGRGETRDATTHDRHRLALSRGCQRVCAVSWVDH